MSITGKRSRQDRDVEEKLAPTQDSTSSSSTSSTSSHTAARPTSSSATASSSSPTDRRATAIESVLESTSEFATLGLPLPDLDALERAVWDVGEGEIKKRYRKVSMLVHPDKNAQSKSSQDAFAKVAAAYKALLDTSSRERIVKDYIENILRSRPANWLPDYLKSASAKDVDRYRADQRKKAAALRSQDVAHHESAVKEAFERRREEAAQKRAQARERERRRQEYAELRKQNDADSSSDDSDSDSSEDEDAVIERVRQRNLKRKRLF